MKMTRSKKALSFILCIVLIAAIALFTTACNDNKTTDDTTTAVSTTEAPEATVIGEGKTEFTFTVTDLEGNETVFEIKTDKKTVGDALLEHKLIDGDEGEFGLYVKEVNGTTLDYDTDGAYWSFYVNGEYAMSGVDATEIVDGTHYEFKAEKA